MCWSRRIREMGYTTGSTYVTWQCADVNVLRRWLIPQEVHTWQCADVNVLRRQTAYTPGSTYMAMCWCGHIIQIAYIPTIWTYYTDDLYSSYLDVLHRSLTSQLSGRITEIPYISQLSGRITEIPYISQLKLPLSGNSCWLSDIIKWSLSICLWSAWQARRHNKWILIDGNGILAHGRWIAIPT